MINVYFIIVNYNGTDDTIECLNSLRNMYGYDSIINIVVVDNCSSEGKDKIKKYCEKNNVAILELNENLGFGVANNIGAKYAAEHQADYIILLNNDTIVSRNMMSIIERYFDRNKVLSPIIYYHSNPKEIWCAGGYLSRMKGTSVHYTKYDDYKITFLSGCCMIVPIDIYKDIGLFDDKYFMYYEDTDLSIKLINNNVDMEIVKECAIWHKVGQTSNKHNGLQEYYLTRNRLYMLNKHKKFFCYNISLLYFMITRFIIFISRIFKRKTVKYMLEGIIDHINKNYGRKEF